MSEITIFELGDGSGLWCINYINGEWAVAYGLTKQEAEYYLANFDYDEIARRWGWE